MDQSPKDQLQKPMQVTNEAKKLLPAHIRIQKTELLAFAVGAILAGLSFWLMRRTGRELYLDELAFLAIGALVLGIGLGVAEKVVAQWKNRLWWSSYVMMSFATSLLIALQVLHRLASRS